MRFKERSHLYKIKVQGETASADKKAAASMFSMQIKYTYHGRRIQGFHNQREVSAQLQSFKGQTDSLDRANVAGDLKVETSAHFTMLKNPRALKNYDKYTLLVLNKWNNKAWKTAHLFTTWFTEYFKPDVETYCSDKNIFKTVLLTENAHGHPRALTEMYIQH